MAGKPGLYCGCSHGGYISATATFMDNVSAHTVSPSDSHIGDDSAANESVRMMRLYRSGLMTVQVELNFKMPIASLMTSPSVVS
ncbi:hypothetical protein Tco_1502553 [Tanacetum coccineum]